jgi:hypothetical protein
MRMIGATNKVGFKMGFYAYESMRLSLLTALGAAFILI